MGCSLIHPPDIIPQQDRLVRQKAPAIALSLRRLLPRLHWQCSLLAATPVERDREAHLQDCERLLLEGSSTNVFLDELVGVEKLVAHEQLTKELENEAADDNVLSMEEVAQYLTRARRPHRTRVQNRPYVRASCLATRIR